MYTCLTLLDLLQTQYVHVEYAFLSCLYVHFEVKYSAIVFKLTIFNAFPVHVEFQRYSLCRRDVTLPIQNQNKILCIQMSSFYQVKKELSYK